MKTQDYLEEKLTSIFKQLQSLEQTLTQKSQCFELNLNQGLTEQVLKQLRAELKTTKAAFNQMEDKVQDLILYVCHSMTWNNSNIGDIHGME